LRSRFGQGCRFGCSDLRRWRSGKLTNAVFDQPTGSYLVHLNDVTSPIHGSSVGVSDLERELWHD
jgi:hypothetical protein